jgi:hypothetical protein
MNTPSLHDRMLAVYRNEMPDQLPLGIYTRYLPHGETEREIRNAGMGIIDYVPVVTMLPPPWHVLPGFLTEASNVEFRVRQTWINGQRLERREFDTPVGSITQEIMEDSSGAGSEHIRKHYLENVTDYETLQYIVERSIPRSNEEMISQRMSDLGNDGIVIGRLDRNPYQKLLIELVGPQKFLLDLYDFPEAVKNTIETMDAKMDQIFEIALNSQVEVFWQPDNVTADMTPPSIYEEYCLPYYQKHSEQTRSIDKPYIVHMDGRIKPLVSLINQSGFDVIESISSPEMGGNFWLDEAMEAFPSLVVLPNFPSNWSSLPDEEIKTRIHQLRNKADKSRPYMLQVSEDIPMTEWKRVLHIVTESFYETI